MKSSPRSFVCSEVGEAGAEVQAVVGRVIGRAPGPEDVAPWPIAAHQSNRLFDVWHDGRHLVAKAFGERSGSAGATREFAALRLIEGLDLAPKPVYFDPSVGAVVVYEYLDGTMWDRRIPSATELAALAEVWLRLHRIETDGLWPSFSRARSRGDVAQRLRVPIQEYATWAERQPERQSVGRRAWPPWSVHSRLPPH